MSQNTRTTQLSEAGVSIWLDDLSRERIDSGDLQSLIDEKNVVGVTTNPTIFAKALAEGEAYDQQIRELASAGKDVDESVFEITTADVAHACRIFRPLFDNSDGVDGRVSIEVQPALANDTAGTIAEAKKLWERVASPNAFVKIPGTVAGLEAITESIAAGINVNVTLIFSLERHRQVINAYLTGLEKAREAGIDLSTIHSVASFFVSRVDTEVDKRLDALDSDAARALRGKAGIANARLAYEVYEQAFDSERAKGLLAAGATKQRPLWASTGVKDPSFPDTMYVTELVAPNVVNTMPEKTLDAVADHAEITGDTVTGTYTASNKTLNAIADLGISYTDVVELLEKEGVEKFTVSWNELRQTVQKALDAAE